MLPFKDRPLQRNRAMILSFSFLSDHLKHCTGAEDKLTQLLRLSVLTYTGILKLYIINVYHSLHFVRSLLSSKKFIHLLSYNGFPIRNLILIVNLKMFNHRPLTVYWQVAMTGRMSE